MEITKIYEYEDAAFLGIELSRHVPLSLLVLRTVGQGLDYFGQLQKHARMRSNMQATQDRPSYVYGIPDSKVSTACWFPVVLEILKYRLDGWRCQQTHLSSTTAEIILGLESAGLINYYPFHLRET